MAETDESIFTWTDDKQKKHQFNLEKLDSLLYKNYDSFTYKLAQRSSVLKSIFNFFGVKTELEKETDIEVVKQRLEKQNINLNEAKNSIGDNIVSFAVKNQNNDLITNLIECGANINQLNKDGDTALHIAIKRGTEGNVKLLLEMGADVNQQNNDGDTALHIASEKSNPTQVKLLLDRGADINIQNNDGKTALYIAASKCKLARDGYGWEMNANAKNVMQLLYDRGDQQHKEKAIEKVFKGIQDSSGLIFSLKKAFEEIGVIILTPEKGKHYYKSPLEVKVSSEAKSKKNNGKKKQNAADVNHLQAQEQNTLNNVSPTVRATNTWVKGTPNNKSQAQNSGSGQGRY